MLPKMSSFKILPAILTLKMSPKPRSKICSVVVLESIQLSTIANGFCPNEVAFT